MAKETPPKWDEDVQRQIGARMREARRLKGVSLRTLAPTFEMTHGALGHWEKGTNAISLPQLWLLCATLGVSADKILFGVERWPFEKVSYAKVADLEPADRHRLEGGLLSVAADLGVEIKQDPPSAAARQAKEVASFLEIAEAASASAPPTPAKRKTGAQGHGDASQPRARKQKA
jgi:transcriptional regulator with XRE-family HTH domain